MIRYCNINGSVSSLEDATLKVNDLAILRGYGVFDYFLVRESVPMYIDQYVARFFSSAESLHLEIPYSATELKDLIHELIDANAIPNAGMRLVLTGGYADDGYSPMHPNLLILMHPMPAANEDYYKNGVKTLLHGYQRELPEAKTINYLTGIRLLGEMKKQGATEILYHDFGTIREAVRSNFFVVTKDNKIATPNEQILRGITRHNVISVAKKHHFEVEERPINVEELYFAKEAFITSTIKGVMPVVQVGEQLIGNGKPGEATLRLGKLLEAMDKTYTESAKVMI